MSSGEGTVSLISSEGTTFQVPLDIAQVSKFVADILKDETDTSDEAGPTVPIPSVRADILTKIIDFCTHYKTEPMKKIDQPLKSSNIAETVQQYYSDFVTVEQSLLFELMLAANYMHIQPLIDLACAAVAAMIKGKTPEQIRSHFKIEYSDDVEFGDEEAEEEKKNDIE